MSITIQLTEIPANESVPNRIVTLSENGGNFGSAFDCDIQLPDRTAQVAAKHGCFVAYKDKMMIHTYSGSNITIQGAPLAPGKRVEIEDGTIIGVADYIMLVSVVANMDSEKEDHDKAIAPEQNYQAYFSHSSLDEDDLEDNIVMVDGNESMTKGQTMTQDKTPHFAASGVFSDDPFEDDPFKDEEISFTLNEQTSSEEKKIAKELESIETFITEDSDDNDADIILMNKKLIQTTDNEVSHSNSERSQEIKQLVGLLEHQIVNNNDQQSKIFQAIDKTLTTFMNEFSPEHLEDVFDDFGTPFFVQKEKQYWRSYRKSFNRRLDKGEYHRMFKALLLENMQGNGTMNKDDKGEND
jgi:predicted component of type VI protein secretion system